MSFFTNSVITNTISFSQGNLSAQRKAKAVRAAECKQKARKVEYGYRTSADLEKESKDVLHKIDIHIGVQMYRIILAAFVPIPCPRCKELRGIGEFNHYPCACGHGDIHGHRKTFFPKKTPSCVFCGTVRLKDGEFRSCVCIERALEYLLSKEKIPRSFFPHFFTDLVIDNVFLAGPACWDTCWATILRARGRVLPT